MFTVDIAKLPDDVAQLKAIICKYQREYHTLYCEKNYLQEQLQSYLHRRFARKSEKLSAEELQWGSLFDEIEKTVEEKPEPLEETVVVTSYVRRKCGRKAITDELPRVTIEHDIPEDAKRCVCGKELVRIGEDVREQIDKIPAIYFVRRDVMYKYACKSCEGVDDAGERTGVITASTPKTLIPRSIASSGLVADIIVSKFCDHLPLFRQEKMYAREGIALSRQTLSSIALLAAEKCARVSTLMREDVKKSRFVGIDETHVQVLSEEGRGNTTKSWMWVCKAGSKEYPVTLFHYSPSRAHEVINEFLSGYEGIIQSDEYGAYEAFLKGKPNISHAGCMAHARRKFVEAVKVAKSPLAQAIVAHIGKLYAIEEYCQEHNFSEEEVVRYRKEKAWPVLSEIKARLEKEAHHVAPKSLLGKAMSYFFDNWPRLILYLEHGFLPIDNNAVENAIRPFVVGRKNWLFSGSPRGARASSVLYSIIETAKNCGHEPYWYMRYLFEKLPYAQTDEEVRSLLPYHVKPDEIPAKLNVQNILERVLSLKGKEVRTA